MNGKEEAISLSWVVTLTVGKVLNFVFHMNVADNRIDC